MKLFSKIFLSVIFFVFLTACQKHASNVIRVGTITGPETKLMEVAQEVAEKKYGLKIEIVEFTDYVEPNAALNDGSLEANAFQHQPYLDQQIKDRHYKLVAIAKTFLYPMGIYSDKIKNVNDLRENALVGIPNDPSNEGRALLLLQKAGLIELKPGVGLFPTPFDITSNPKKLQFKELDAAQLARSLQDVDIAVINTNFAIPAGLSPAKDAIFVEGKDSPYANIIVVRKDEINDPRIQELKESFQSPEVADAAKKIFNGAAIPAW